MSLVVASSSLSKVLRLREVLHTIEMSRVVVTLRQSQHRRRQGAFSRIECLEHAAQRPSLVQSAIESRRAGEGEWERGQR